MSTRFYPGQKDYIEELNLMDDELAAAPATTTSIGTLINSATAKVTPVDADLVPIADSEATNLLKKVTWANIKATLKAYFDTIYGAQLVFKEEGVNVTTANPVSVNFVGAGVTATGTIGGAITVNVPGAAATAIPSKDDGIQITAASTSFNFVGTGVTATADTAGAVTVTVPDASPTVTNIGNIITAATTKTTLVDADAFGISDSAASNILKEFSWANLKANAKTYFDTLYATVGHNHTGTYSVPITVKEEGSNITTSAVSINFVGTGATATADTAGAVTVTIPGSTGSALTVKDETINVDTAVSSINFAGSGVTATSTTAGAVTVTIPGSTGSALTVKDETINVDTAVSSINFAGGGITATSDTTGAVTVTVPNMSKSIAVKDEGISITADITSLDFVGTGVVATADTAGAVTVTVNSVPSLTIKDETVNVDTAVSSINFAGSGVTATSDTAGAVTVTVNTASSLSAYEEGTSISTAVSSLNFVGTAVTATADTAGAVTVTVNGGFASDGSTVLTGDLQLGQNVGILFEGSTDDAFETKLVAEDPTSDNIITIPNSTMTLAGINIKQTFTAQQRPSYINTTTATGGTSLAYDPDTHGQVATITLTTAGTVTMSAPTNIVEGSFYTLVLKSGDTNARSFAWNSAYKFPLATSPLTSATATNGAYDTITFLGMSSNTLVYQGHQADCR